jgi:hypothetical protein
MSFVALAPGRVRITCVLAGAEDFIKPTVFNSVLVAGYFLDRAVLS